MRFVAIILAVILGTTLPPAEAGRTEIRVQAHVSAMVKLRHAEMVQAVEVPAGGEVHVPHAVTLDVFCNTGAFVVDFHVADPAVEEVAVSGLDVPLRVGAEGGTSVVSVAPEARVARRTLHYRVRYAAGTPPGSRPAPLAVAVRKDW